MNRIVVPLLAVGLLAPAFAELPPTRTPAAAAAPAPPRGRSCASKTNQQKVALAKKRTTHHRSHKRHTSKAATAPASK
jgi:hypothetical protein